MEPKFISGNRSDMKIIDYLCRMKAFSVLNRIANVAILILMVVALSAPASAAETWMTAVLPEQGRLTVGESNPNGLKQVTLSFDREVAINAACTQGVAIYTREPGSLAENSGAGNEADWGEPCEIVTAESVEIDRMTRRMAAIVFRGSYLDVGEYRIEIPAGLWIDDDGSESEAITLNYEIYKEWSIEPADYTVHGSMSRWSLTADAADKVEWKSYYDEPRIELVSGQRFCSVKCVSAQGNRIEIEACDEMHRPVTVEKNGNYVLVIPRSTLRYTFYGETYPADLTDFTTGYNTDDIRVHFTITPISKPVIAPCEGELKEFGDFILTFPSDCQLIQADPTLESMLFVRQGDVTTETAYLRYKVPNDGVDVMKRTVRLTPVLDENTDEIDLREPLPGEYTLRLSRGFIRLKYLDEEIYNAPYEYRFEVKTRPFDFTVQPVSGAELPEISEIVLTFATSVALNESAGEVSVLDENGLRIDTEVAAYPQRGYGEPDEAVEDAMQWRMMFTPPIREKGTYTIILPEGLFVRRDGESLAISLRYAVDGSMKLTDISEDEIFNVYTLEGVEIMRGVPAERVQTLPPGLYIINRQPTLIPLFKQR